MEPYEEYRHIPQWLGLCLIILLCSSVITWAMLLYVFVIDLPRQWDFGGHTHVPAAAPYTTAASPPSPEEHTPPLQVQTFPGAELGPKTYPPRTIILEKRP